MSKVGQPQKNIIDVLKTIFWYKNIELKVVPNLLKEELEELYESEGCNIWHMKLEEQIRLRESFQSSKLNASEVMTYQTNPNKIGHSFNQAESRIWYKYARGETKPNRIKLARVDQVIDNASLYFKHPIWDFLKKRSTSKSELNNFFDKFEETSKEVIRNKSITEPAMFHVDMVLDEDEFLKYGNILDFYSYILYSYYMAKMDLDSEKMDNCIAFFASNLLPIMSNVCLESIFFLKLCQIHMKPFKSSIFEEFEIFNHFQYFGWLEEIQHQLKNENDNYDFLYELHEKFILD